MKRFVVIYFTMLALTALIPLLVCFTERNSTDSSALVNIFQGAVTVTDGFTAL